MWEFAIRQVGHKILSLVYTNSAFMKFVLVFCLLSTTFLSCNNNDDSVNGGSGDKDFQQLSDEYLKGHFTWRPQAAVALGYHEYDGKLSDLSRASLDAELTRLKDYDQRLAKIDTAALSAKMFFDFRLLHAAIKYEIFGFEDLHLYDLNPMYYAGAADLNIYVKRDYAPLEQRIGYMISVEKQLPALFTAGKANLKDSIPKPFIETAISMAEGTVSFLKGDLLIAVKDVKDDSLLASFKNVNNQAIDSINSFISWLKKEKLPKANDHYSIGRDNYRKMLQYTEDVTMSPEEILEVGLAELKREQDRFNRFAKIIDSTKKPLDVLAMVQKEHPVADSLIPEARKNLEIIRQFIVDKNILTMPSEVRVQVKEMPQYARSLGTAAMDVPGPFEKNATEAYYYITPVDAKWTSKQKEDWLSMFDYYTTDNVSIHEAYPGHYTQFLHLNASSATTIQKIFGSYAFIEGWAHYTERMMMDEGYGENGDVVKAAKYRLAQSGDALLRICRLAVSIKMHCQGMKISEGTKFFMDNWYQGEKPSEQEALRGSFDPGYLFYTLGKLQILKLREDYKKQEGDAYSMKKFHDLMLDNGMPPVQFLRELLLTDKASWKNIL